MKHKGTWAVIGLLVLVGLFAAISVLEAQRPPRADAPGGVQVGRYQVVKVDESYVYLLDTATGDLYMAMFNRDFKDYADRPKPGERPRFFDKEKAPDTKPTDKEIFKDKKSIDKDGDFPKDKVKEFPRDKDQDFPKDKEKKSGDK